MKYHALQLRTRNCDFVVVLVPIKGLVVKINFLSSSQQENQQKRRVMLVVARG